MRSLKPVDRAQLATAVADVEALLAAGEPLRALEHCRALRQAAPNDAALLHLSARVNLACHLVEDAYSDLLLAQSLRDDPADAKLLLHIESELIGQQAQRFAHQHRYADAVRAFDRARALAPDNPNIPCAMGHMEMQRGEVEHAIELFRSAAYMNRPDRIAHSNLLLAMTNSDRVAPRELFEEHLGWARRVGRGVTPASPRVDDPDPDRVLRVGYVSPDFRQHPVGHFILPVLQHHDPAQVQVTCYDDRPAPPSDPMAPLMRACRAQWVDVSGLTGAELVERVRADRIDILFDLAVHTDRNRLTTFAAKPAPIQISWLGYVGTTGTTAMDFRITDSEVDPPGESDAFSTERLLRLPEIFWCYAPFPHAPPVRDPAAVDPAAPVCFGTATRLAKISETCLDLWCRVLRAVDHSIIRLGAEPFADQQTVGRWLEKFAARGIDRSRIQLIHGLPQDKYLELLGANDIGLDTFPFNGGTTVCHTLYMGTPVVALRGRAGVGRVTSSICRAVGLTDLIADDADEWVARNVALAGDLARRARLRGSLREQFLASPAGDGARFTRRLEQALRQVWREKCVSDQKG